MTILNKDIKKWSNANHYLKVSFENEMNIFVEAFLKDLNAHEYVLNGKAKMDIVNYERTDLFFPPNTLNKNVDCVMLKLKDIEIKINNNKCNEL